MNNTDVYAAYTNMLSKFMIDPNTGKSWNQDYLEMQNLTISANTKSYTLEDILNEVHECQNLLQAIGFDMEGKKYTTRWLPKTKVKTLGMCSCTVYNNYIISINESYLRLASPENIHNTIMHEVIHSIDGCANHGPNFKRAGEKVCKYYVFTSITRLGKDKTYMDEVVATKYKYQLRCKTCGHTWNYMRRTQKMLSICNSTTSFHNNKQRKCCGPFEIITL